MKCSCLIAISTTADHQIICIHQMCYSWSVSGNLNAMDVASCFLFLKSREKVSEQRMNNKRDIRSFWRKPLHGLINLVTFPFRRIELMTVLTQLCTKSLNFSLKLRACKIAFRKASFQSIESFFQVNFHQKQPFSPIVFLDFVDQFMSYNCVLRYPHSSNKGSLIGRNNICLNFAESICNNLCNNFVIEIAKTDGPKLIEVSCMLCFRDESNESFVSICRNHFSPETFLHKVNQFLFYSNSIAFEKDT